MKFNFKDLIELTAAQYLVLSTVTPMACFMIVFHKLPDITTLVPILSLSLCVLGFNTANMVFDAELDKINKPKRQIPSGKVTKIEASILASALYFLGAITAITVNGTFSILIAFFIVISLLYSAPPLRLRKYWWGSSFTGGILYGLIPFLAMESLGNRLFAEPIFLVFFTFIIIFISNSKDFEDMVGEKKTGIQSLSTNFGEIYATYLIIAGNAILLLSMALLSIQGIIQTKYLTTTAVSGVVLIMTSIFLLKDVREIKIKNYISEAVSNQNKFGYVLQSEAVTISILYAIVVQLLYALTAISII